MGLPRTIAVVLGLGGGTRIVARPSGTEPKIKFYFDLREPMQKGETVHAAELRAGARMKELEAAFCAIAGVRSPDAPARDGLPERVSVGSRVAGDTTSQE